MASFLTKSIMAGQNQRQSDAYHFDTADTAGCNKRRISLVAFFFVSFLLRVLIAYPAQAASASGTTMPNATEIVDSNGVVWTVENGFSYENGVADGGGTITLLLYYDSVIYADTTGSGWWSHASGKWVQVSGDPQPASEGGSTIPGATEIVAANGVIWTVLNESSYEDGVADGGGTITLLLYYDSVVYADTTGSGWWSHASGRWVQVSGDPRQTAVNGQCGAADDVAVSAIPASGLCAAGTASSVSGSSQWSWTCAGSNGGTSASCSAPLLSSVGFYVATNGSDSNPGTLAAPFATFAKAQSAMRASSTVKTTFIRAGNYSPSASASCAGGSTVLSLNSSDAGETWSYYPPDGYDTAVIAGGGNISMFACLSTSNVIMNGLNIGSFTVAGLYITGGSSGVILENNILHDMPEYAFNMDDQGGQNTSTQILNNDIYNIGYEAVGAWPTHGYGAPGTIIANNFIYNTCTAASDCGAIYDYEFNTNSRRNTTISITNNYVRDTGAGGWGMAVYLDDGASDITVSGNIMSGTGGNCAQIHGGENNLISGNVCDEEASGKNIVYYQYDGTTSMTGNSFTNNIVIANSGGAGGGFVGIGSPQTPMTIENNVYWNYAGTELDSSGSGGAGSDANPFIEDPQISAWTYSIASGSPVYDAPVSFPQISGGWGPPGFVVSQTGTAPSPLL